MARYVIVLFSALHSEMHCSDFYLLIGLFPSFWRALCIS